MIVRPPPKDRRTWYHPNRQYQTFQITKKKSNPTPCGPFKSWWWPIIIIKFVNEQWRWHNDNVDRSYHHCCLQPLCHVTDNTTRHKQEHQERLRQHFLSIIANKNSLSVDCDMMVWQWLIGGVTLQREERCVVVCGHSWLGSIPYQHTLTYSVMALPGPILATSGNQLDPPLTSSLHTNFTQLGNVDVPLEHLSIRLYFSTIIKILFWQLPLDASTEHYIDVCLLWKTISLCWQVTSSHKSQSQLITWAKFDMVKNIFLILQKSKMSYQDSKYVTQSSTGRYLATIELWPDHGWATATCMYQGPTRPNWIVWTLCVSIGHGLIGI